MTAEPFIQTVIVLMRVWKSARAGRASHRRRRGLLRQTALSASVRQSPARAARAAGEVPRSPLEPVAGNRQMPGAFARRSGGQLFPTLRARSSCRARRRDGRTEAPVGSGHADSLRSRAPRSGGCRSHPAKYVGKPRHGPRCDQEGMMGRPPALSPENKTLIVTDILAGRCTVTQADRDHAVSPAANWKRRFLDAGRAGLAGGPGGDEERRAAGRRRGGQRLAAGGGARRRGAGTGLAHLGACAPGA